MSWAPDLTTKKKKKMQTIIHEKKSIKTEVRQVEKSIRI